LTHTMPTTRRGYGMGTSLNKDISLVG